MIELDGWQFPNGNDFKAFLATQPPEGKAGVCVDAAKCPLAGYLLVLNPNAVAAEVDGDTFCVKGPGYYYNEWSGDEAYGKTAHPGEWAVDFVSDVDEIGAASGEEKYNATFAECATIMNNLKDLSEECS